MAMLIISETFLNHFFFVMGNVKSMIHFIISTRYIFFILIGSVKAMCFCYLDKLLWDMLTPVHID